MFYSASTGGFYSRDIHGDNMPADVVEITPEGHAALLAGQSAGQIIQADENGAPVLQDPPTHVPSREDIEAQRLRAYADPQTGSDRYFAEAVRLEAMGDPIEAEAARMNGIVRYQEIKDLYPWL